MTSSNSDENFMQFVTSELSIYVVEHNILIPTGPNNDTDEAKLLKSEDLAQSASDNDVPQNALKYLAG